MPIVAALLFGSVARSDHSEGSDTDLLMVKLDNETRHVSVGGLSLFFYPWTTLEHNARNGDLFVWHLIREAKPIFDPDGYLPRLESVFQHRSSYASEICRATELGWFLARFGQELNSDLQAKRALWCVRTILIARSAERGDPVFAPHLLANQTQSTGGRNLLFQRHGERNIAEVRQSLRSFLEQETTSDSFNKLADRSAFIERFRATSNKVALKTLQQEEVSQAGYS